MIESGSHSPGISADMFRLPPHTALRYERPEASLRDHLASYFVLDSEHPYVTSEWMLPSWSKIWFVFTDEPVKVRIGNRRYDLPQAALCGVTSRAMPVAARGGVTIGVDVSPLGWARLFSQSAEALRDRVTPLQELMRPPWVDELTMALGDSDRALDVKGILDAFFASRMPGPHPDEPIVARIMALLVDDGIADLATAAAEVGIDPRALRRLSKRYFGFPPKTLMMRTRFLRSFLAMLGRGAQADPGWVPPAYHDASHFIRDAKRFLGMTPRQFLSLDAPFLHAALRARALVLGAPTSSLAPRQAGPTAGTHPRRK